MAGASRLTGRVSQFSTATVWVVLALLVVIEAGFELMPEVRGQAISALAFRDETVTLWPIQMPSLNAVTYAWLHANPYHLASNVAIMLLFALTVCRRIGAVRWLILYTAAGVAAALTFATMSKTQGLLVGASGAIYGVISAGKVWEGLYLRRQRGPWRRFVLSVALFILLNIVLVVVSAGDVAWSAHLGGAVAGALLALALRPGGVEGRLII